LLYWQVSRLCVLENAGDVLGGKLVVRRPRMVSVGRLLAQLGITCQRPLYHASEKDEALVQQWLQQEYPRIRALAQREKADIYFGDAAHMRSDHHSGRTWSKKGETPMVSSTAARYRMSLISAVTSRGRMRFMTKEKGGVNAAIFIEFLKRLMIGSRNKSFLIVARPCCQQDQGVRRRSWRQAAAVL
jgi:hypothetical protein